VVGPNPTTLWGQPIELLRGLFRGRGVGLAIGYRSFAHHQSIGGAGEVGSGQSHTAIACLDDNLLNLAATVGNYLADLANLFTARQDHGHARCDSEGAIARCSSAASDGQHIAAYRSGTATSGRARATR
jgi:hypothetical protein